MRVDGEMDDPTTTMTRVDDEPEYSEHWRARRLRKTIDGRRRQREKGELQLVNRKNGPKTRDTASLRALQVRHDIYFEVQYALSKCCCSILGVTVLPQACIIPCAGFLRVYAYLHT